MFRCPGTLSLFSWLALPWLALFALLAAIKFKIGMGSEERRTRRVTKKRCEDQIDRLQLEYEDLELDMDENGVSLNQVLILST